MSVTTISASFNKLTSGGLKLTLKDSSSAAADVSAIDSVVYTLTNLSGIVVNGRSSVSLSVGNPVLVPFSPLDLAFSGAAASGRRRLTVKWTYTDTNLGAGATAIEEYDITVDNRVNEG